MPRPPITTEPAVALTENVSFRAPPFMTTVSFAPSPLVPPSVPARSTVTSVASVREVVDRDGVGAAQRVEVEGLDIVEIHGDVADVAGEPTRSPLAEMSMFSLTLAPLKSIVSVPAWPSTVSLPSPGSHWKSRRRLPSWPRRCPGCRR